MTGVRPTKTKCLFAGILLQKDKGGKTNKKQKIATREKRQLLAAISRVPDQNGVSLLYIMLELHHSGWEPSI